MIRLIFALLLILTAATADAGIFSRFRSRSVNVTKSYSCSGGSCRVEYSKRVDLNGPPMPHDEWVRRKTVIVNRGVQPESENVAPTADPPKKVNVTVDINVNPYE